MRDSEEDKGEGRIKEEQQKKNTKERFNFK
jgi:hypothetical protein